MIPDIFHIDLQILVLLDGRGRLPKISDRDILLLFATQVEAKIRCESVENLHLLVIINWKIVSWIDNSPWQALTTRSGVYSQPMQANVLELVNVSAESGRNVELWHRCYHALAGERVVSRSNGKSSIPQRWSPPTAGC